MKITTFPLILIACLALSACSDLKEDTTKITTPDEYFRTAAEVETFILPAYQALHPETYFRYATWIQAVSSDEAATPAQGNFGEGYWLNLQRHTLDAEVYAYENKGAWDWMLGGAHNCNRILSVLQSTHYPEVAAPFVAELKALRAFFYLQLIDQYGNVPILLPGDSVAAACTRPRSEVFDFIEKSLLESLPSLSKTVGGEMHGRMNFYAAQALLAKLYLNAEIYRGTPAWNEALAACDAVLQSGEFNLSADYFENFKLDPKSSLENIFVSASLTDDTYRWRLPYAYSLHAVHLGSLLGQSISNWGTFLVVQPDFYARYDSQDARIKSFFIGQQLNAAGNPILDAAAEPTDPDGAPINYTPEINLNFPLRQSGIRFAKFEIDLACPFTFDCAQTRHDYPIFRYADILLMKAEALLRQNASTGEALALVNAVRERSGAAPFGDLTLEKLLDERGRELFLEGWRRSDLIRFGKFNEAWWEKEADASAHVNLFPIPGQAINQNPCLVQNPGY